METITIKLPVNSEVYHAKLAIAIAFFENEIYSSGQAAEFLNIKRTEFLDILNEKGICVFSEEIDDLKKVNEISI